MRIAGRDKDSIGGQAHALFGDQRFPACNPAELAREHAHERDRQMLRDKDRYTNLPWQGVEEGSESMDAARRRAYGQYVDWVGWHGAKQALNTALGRHRCRPIDRRVTKRLQLAEEDLGELAVEPPCARLRH